jgi:DNA-binding NarL/FixJ family response regulator
MKHSKRVNPPAKKGILLVDDHPMMREGLALLIGQELDLEVCGQADTARVAMELIASTQPNLVLLDITLPDKNGLEVIKDIQAMYPARKF